LKFGLIGHPVAHSLSPVIQRAAYRELGVSHEYTLLDCPAESDVEQVAARLRSGELAGVNITIPWKRAAFALADEHSALAAQLQVANVLAPSGSRLIAHNTDALALEVEFRELVTTSRAIVLGSGGATPAVLAACRAAGIGEVFVSARRFDAAKPQRDWPSAEELASLGAQLLAWPESSQPARAAFEQACAGAGLAVQCTSAGMHGADSGEPIAKLLPWARMPQDALAYDVIYAPLETPFLRVAREAGRRTRHGLSMLVGQAALSVEIWLGQRPPLEPLLQAALTELASRGRT
jgi:shikimate dehydrogenase